MQIVEDLTAEVPDTNAFHWGFKDFSEPSNENVLFYGYNSATNTILHNRYADFKRRIFFNNWAPCEFAQPSVIDGVHTFDRESFFNEVYSICPYTNQWLNSLGLDREYANLFYPYSPSLIPERQEKQYDVIYHGGIHGIEHVQCLQVMKNFAYRYCTMTSHINNLTIACIKNGYATNLNLAFQEKVNLIAKTKISVCYNIVHVNQEHIPNIMSFDKWNENEAFKEVGENRWNIMPQFKTRMHEAAFSRTLNLVMRDPWNIAELYYKPGEDFVYFEDQEDLNKKIKDIVNNWNDYQHIVDNAYEKSKSYQVSNFLNTIRNKQ